MKKILSALLSLSLAAVMGLSFAACSDTTDPDKQNPDSDQTTDGGNGGTTDGDNGGTGTGNSSGLGTDHTKNVETLKAAANATAKLGNYTFTMDEIDSTNVVDASGKPLSETEKLTVTFPGQDPQEKTGAELLSMLKTAMGTSSLPLEQHTGSRIIYMNNGSYIYKEAQTQRGVVKTDEKNQVIYDTEYYALSATKLTRYFIDKTFSTLVRPNAYAYSGFTSAEAAKKVAYGLAYNDSYNMLMPALLEYPLEGRGENSNRKGTLSDLADLFTFDAATGVCTGSLSNEFMDSKVDVDIVATLKDGKIVDYTVTQHVIQSVGEEFGFTVDKELYGALDMQFKCVYSDIDKTTVSTPEEFKSVTAPVPYKVIGNKTDFNSVITKYSYDKAELSWYEDSNQSSHVEVTVDYDLTAKSAYIYKVKWNFSTDEYSEPEAYFIRVKENNMLNVWEADTFDTQKSPRPEVATWKTPVATAVTGDAKEAVLAEMEKHVSADNIAFARGLSTSKGGAAVSLDNLYESFDYSGLTSMTGNLFLGDKAVEVGLYYYIERRDSEIVGFMPSGLFVETADGLIDITVRQFYGFGERDPEANIVHA